MANNRVELANGTVLMDLTDTTATASDVFVGKSFYDAAGVKTAGTAHRKVMEPYVSITVPSNVRAVNVDFRGAEDLYDIIFVYADIELTGSDWIYSVPNGSTTSGGVYTTKRESYNGLLAMQIKQKDWTSIAIENQNNFYVSQFTMHQLYVYTYTSSILIKAGGKFTIYGGNYADL